MELLLALLMLSLVGYVALQSLWAAVREYNLHSDRMVALERARNVELYLRNFLPNAGLGLPESWSSSEFPFSFPAGVSALQVLIVRPITLYEPSQVASPDRFAVVYPVDRGLVLARDLASGDTSLTVTWDPSRGPSHLSSLLDDLSSSGLKSYVVLQGDRSLYRISSLDLAGLTLRLSTPVRGFHPRFRPLLMVRVKVFLPEPDGTLRVDDLMGGGAQPLERGIELLKVHYDEANGLFRYWIIARGETFHQEPIEAGRVYRVKGQDYTPSGDSARYVHAMVHGAVRVRNPSLR